MRDYNFLKDRFIEKHEIIDNSEHLDNYINFLINYEINESYTYKEKHHILPISTFPEFENEDWNIIELKYSDHVNAHLYLFKSINIRQYQRPLNFMMSCYKNSEEISNAAKRGWVNLKEDTEKYNKWRNSKSESMKSLSSDEQRRRANIFWSKISDEEYLNFSQKMKDCWTEDKRIEKSKQMNEYYSNPENINKKRIETKTRWDSMTEEERVNFNEKMKTVNKDESKRKKAGAKIKNLWESEDYLNKMRNRKHRPGSMIKIIKPNGEEIIMETMKKLEIEYSFSVYLIRKYRDTDNRISDIDLNENNLILLNSIIKSIK